MHLLFKKKEKRHQNTKQLQRLTGARTPLRPGKQQ